MKFYIIVNMIALLAVKVEGHIFAIPYEHSTSAQLKTAHVKEIRVYRDNGKDDLIHIYLVDNLGVIISHLHFDNFSKTNGPLLEEYSYNNSSSIYWRGRKSINGNKILYNKTKTFFSVNKKILRIEKEENSDNDFYSFEDFDTTYAEGINSQKFILQEDTRDTLRKIIHKKDRKVESNIVMQKDSGRWIELERTSTSFDYDGHYIIFEQYKNGKLQTCYTRKERESVVDSAGGFEDENRNLLPTTGLRIDTLYSNSLDIKFPIENTKGGKYRVVIIYNFNNVNAEIVKLFNSGGLLLKYMFVPNLISNERYEYDYW